jgi:hypothetical protein
MLKRFSISLIVVASTVYGSLFGLGLYYDTGFFDEFSIQLNRASGRFTKKEEVAVTKFLLKSIVNNEQPPETWNGLISHNQQKDDTQLFYYYKIWAVNAKLSIKEISESYPIFSKIDNNIQAINMRYGKDKPVLQFSFFRNKAGKLKTGLFFPINEPPLEADYNGDGKINAEDLALAKKAVEKSS